MCDATRFGFETHGRSALGHEPEYLGGPWYLPVARHRIQELTVQEGGEEE